MSHKTPLFTNQSSSKVIDAQNMSFDPIGNLSHFSFFWWWYNRRSQKAKPFQEPIRYHYEQLRNRRHKSRQQTVINAWKRRSGVNSFVGQKLNKKRRRGGFVYNSRFGKILNCKRMSLDIYCLFLYFFLCRDSFANQA